MHKIIFEKPYEFIPATHATFWPSVIKLYLRRFLRKAYAVHSVEGRNIDRLKASIDAGHGILVTPNHSRMCDPFVLGQATRPLRTHYYVMVSWHAYQQSWFRAKMIRWTGGFSVYREGTDRRAVTEAIDLLAAAKRPVIVFPEGALSRHNDQLMAMMDGVSLMARAAAKRRAKNNPPGKVVVHPVAIRYFFQGNLEETLTPVLNNIESHFAWRPKQGKPLLERIRDVGEAYLALKEIEYFGHAREGDIYHRVDDLIDHVLLPLEEEWGITDRASHVVGRVKDLRVAILPDMVDGNLTEEERERRWQQLSASYYAQQLSCYPRDYILGKCNMPEHVLETVESLEEDLMDQFQLHGPIHAVVDIGNPIEVSEKRDRNAEVDPVMAGIEAQLTSMLSELAAESPRV